MKSVTNNNQNEMFLIEWHHIDSFFFAETLSGHLMRLLDLAKPIYINVLLFSTYIYIYIATYKHRWTICIISCELKILL